MSTEDHFAFHLKPDEQSRMRRVVKSATGAMQPWTYALLVTSYALNFTIGAIRQHWWLASIQLGLALCWVVLWIRSPKKGRLAVEGDLRLTDSGFEGTLDRAPTQIDWSDIANIADIDDAIVIFRRKNLGPVAIPKSSISDIASLWAVLEDRLVSKRGLIRSPAPRSRILNSAY